MPSDGIDTKSAAKTGAPVVNQRSLLENWLSVAGIILAASSFFAVACLIVIDMFRRYPVKIIAYHPYGSYSYKIYDGLGKELEIDFVG